MGDQNRFWKTEYRGESHRRSNGYHIGGKSYKLKKKNAYGSCST
ncbi:conserved hypothetical protein [Histoplasma mississippiense (nom. inval.)]|nr:conserved hypothetical protein [Histoplasma mississippiense (nom. inval.)]EDN04976.1 conserved hypothetical protein [Histoplasma mississippiense (nom. inval.)]